MAYIRRLPSGKWQATVRMADGSRSTRSDPLRRVVARWATDAEAAIRRGEWADPRDGRMTVGEWYVAWSRLRDIEVATRARDGSHWRQHVGPRWADVRLRSVTPMDVEAWIVDMRQRRVGATTVHQSTRLLRHMMTDAVRHRMVVTDPTVGVSIPRPPKHVDRFLSFPEFDALHQALSERPATGARDACMASLMAMCGLRFEEVAGLHSHRIDRDRLQLLVVEVLRRDGTIKAFPKSHAGQRAVPVPAAVMGELAQVMAPSGRVFNGVGYVNWRRRVFAPAVLRAGLAAPLPTIHDLRHSYGSWLADAGVPPHEIAALMGHSSLRATERYLHASEVRMSRARAALNRPSAS